MTAGCYLLHFSAATLQGPAQHYLGYGDPLQRRVRKHLRGSSKVAIVNAFRATGARIAMIRVFPNADRSWERAWKRRGEINRLCPLCIGNVRRRKRDAKRARKETCA